MVKYSFWLPAISTLLVGAFCMYEGMKSMMLGIREGKKEWIILL